MADEPFYKPNRTPPPPRPPKPGEPLFEFVHGDNRIRCELRDHGESGGVETQFFANDEFHFSRRFDTRAFYACTAHYNKGPAVCPHVEQWPMEELDGEVVATIMGDVLTPDLVEDVIREARAMFDRSAQPDRQDQLRRELAVVEREQARMADAVARGASDSRIGRKTADDRNEATRVGGGPRKSVSGAPRALLGRYRTSNASWPR
jgi:hypothetical protein